MSEEVEEKGSSPPIGGRTWADVFVGATYITGGVVFLAVMGGIVYFLVGKVPFWFFIAIGSSLVFIPFMMERAKEDSSLILVTDGPHRLTEYRVGNKVGLEIDGNPVYFQSKSGVNRKVLSSINVENKTAIGSEFANHTQIDQVRDLTTLQRMVDMLQSTLKESRISSQTVGVEVEKQSIQIVDWALKTIYGAIIPTEISEAFGIDEVESELEFDDTVEDLAETFE
tara:strand:+ start:189 stop:866 length:678 start_codon:yes stop_codon:yes gene_type:complete